MPSRHVARRGAPALSALLLTTVALAGQSIQPVNDGVSPERQQLVARASQGHLKDEVRLAGDYLLGRGVPRDPKRSAYWYGKAADQGDPAAQTEMGFFYAQGIGVQADPARAAQWYQRAMVGGSQVGKLNLAVMYLMGNGVRRDVLLGMDMLGDLANKKNPVAEDYLGLVYYAGYGGVGPDPRLAEKWFAQAAKQHRPEAEYSMGTLYSTDRGHRHDPAKAAVWLRSSAGSGYVPAMHALGLLLVNHPELPQKAEEARGMLEAAAEAGMWRSSVVLGVMARDGKEEPANPAEACRWFLIAAAQGGSEAKKLLRADLAVCARKLTPSSQKEEEEEAGSWAAQHARQELFVFGSRLQTGAFPLAEIPALDSQPANEEKGLRN